MHEPLSPGHGDRSPDPSVAEFADRFTALEQAIGCHVHGAREAIRLSLVCLLARGHLLIEDLPGVGKTTLARTLAFVIGAPSSRVQFTPDLLPSDILGVNILRPDTHDVRFRPGPVFANVVHADEINRASPKVQSALLEVMEERHVTIDGVRHPVPDPFLVVATQNPVELDGTFPLPEAQLDRFLIRTSMGAPTMDEEIAMVLGQRASGERTVAALLNPDDLLGMIACADAVHASEEAVGYAAAIARETRTSPDVRMGASPRATLGLVRAARAVAASEGRGFVTPDDLRALASAVLAHRISCNPSALIAGRTAEDVVAEAVRTVRVPRQRSGA